MRGRPERSEAAESHFLYIDRVKGDDICSALETQMEDALEVLREISEEKSLHRYAPEKWSIRQLLNHVSDSERIFAYRALWFARGLDKPLAGYDEKIAAAAAEADAVSWANHVAEFRGVRLTTVAFFRNLPEEAWMRTGVANEKRVTVRALAYIIAGHVEHHMGILRERYL
jgi:uncharacterized damage-inducible protein DinB